MDRNRFKSCLILTLLFSVISLGETRGTSTTQSRTRSYLNGNKFSILLPSFVVHGIKPSESSSESMPRRMDNEGSTVITPGIGFEYRNPESGLLVVGAMIKDCYDNLAGTIQVGKAWSVSRWTQLAATFGIYARQTPMQCQQRVKQSDSVALRNSNTRNWQESNYETETICEPLDDLSRSFMTNFNDHSIDIIPMPFLHFSTALYRSRDLQIDLKVMSNFVLNEVGIGIPF